MSNRAARGSYPLETEPIRPKPKVKRNYASVTLQEALQMIGRETLTRWHLESEPCPPSDYLLTHLRHLAETFDLKSSEQAKTLLIDAMFVEVVPLHPGLKVWKSTPLDTDTLTGVADYLVTPNRAYVATPLLAVAEAKRDDFERGEAQCLAEMIACQRHNALHQLNLDIYGIVSNGQGWQFYKLTTASEVLETGLYTVEDLPLLLGALNVICAECVKNSPKKPDPS
jgi:hypothetical protein